MESRILNISQLLNQLHPQALIVLMYLLTSPSHLFWSFHFLYSMLHYTFLCISIYQSIICHLYSFMSCGFIFFLLWNYFFNSLVLWGCTRKVTLKKLNMPVMLWSCSVQQEVFGKRQANDLLQLWILVQYHRVEDPDEILWLLLSPRSSEYIGCYLTSWIARLWVKSLHIIQHQKIFILSMKLAKVLGFFEGLWR